MGTAVTVISVIVFTLWLYLRGEIKEQFTFVGTVQESTYEKLPSVPVVEVYHDGDVVALATIEELVEGLNPYPVGTQIALMLKNYDQFGGAGFRTNRFRITLKKYVQNDGFEYWQCSAVKL